MTTLLFPGRRDFRSFFSSVTTKDGKRPTPHVHRFKDHMDFKRRRPPDARMEIGPYCATPDFNGLWVVPTQETVSAIVANTIGVADDVMDFRLTDRGDGTALLICGHSRILGDVWLAEIDLATVRTDQEVHENGSL